MDKIHAWKKPMRFEQRELAPHRQPLTAMPGRREIAAIVRALIPSATGAVPDGLDLGTIRFNPAPRRAVIFGQVA